MRRRFLSVASVIAGLLAPALALSAAADAEDVPGLHVIGGAVWQADNAFAVEWQEDPTSSTEVEYALRDAGGNPLPGYEVHTTVESVVGAIHVPDVPGPYIFEAWMKHPRFPERQTATSRVPLYFDDADPGPVAVSAPRWVAPDGKLAATITPPPGPFPVSGIRGYAVSLDDRPDGAPCATVGRCSVSETDLSGGIGDTAVAFSSPPQGTGFIHAVAVSNAGVACGAVATTRVDIDGTPPEVRVDGVPTGWAAGPVRATAVADDPLSGMAPAGPGGPLTALAVDGGPPLVSPGDSATTVVSGEGVHKLEFYGRDAVGNSGDGGLPFSRPGSAVVRIDETGPRVRLAAPDPTDPERIEATVADSLSGPDNDRGSIAVRRAGAAGEFETLPTDVRRGRLFARWSSDDYPRGAYEFRAVGFDQAGNATTTGLGEDGRPFVLHNPVKRVARLAFGFGSGRLVFQRCVRAGGGRRCHRAVVRSFAKRPAARTLPCCHGAVVGGRLVDAAGNPLAGQTVEVVEALARGARNASRRTALTTDGDGRFSTRLAVGPSRAVTAEFPGTRRLTRSTGRALRLRVRAAIRFRTSTTRVRVGGPPVVFSGRIAHPEARLPKAGLPVQLEFHLPGAPWTEFRTVQSDRSGRFRYPYEFSDDDSAGVRFLFRASVAATGDWPFAPADSRPVAVTG